jgi:peptide/nickel transport system permease protein
MSWILKRSGRAFLAIFAVISISFGLLRLLPGGPVSYLRAQLAQNPNLADDPEKLNNLLETYVSMNPDDPLLQQYISYMTSAFTGDFGQSLVHQRPVGNIYIEALPWTIFVMSQSLILFWLIGVVVGASLAYIEGSKLDIFGSTLATLVQSVPYYVVAILLIYILSFQLGVFPTGGKVSPDVSGLNFEFLLSVYYHAALPMASLVLTGWGGVAIGMRGNSISELGSDYVRVGKLRGLKSRRLSITYVMHNAILPIYTNLLIAVGFVMGGSIVLETIFQYPGAGYYMYTGINARDYPLVMGGLIIITIAVQVGLFTADVTYSKLDPRISSGESS